MRKTCDRRRLPSGNSIHAPVPKSTWASSPAAHSIRRNGRGLVSLQLGHESSHAVVLVVKPVDAPSPDRFAGPKDPAPTSPGSPADRARRHSDRTFSDEIDRRRILDPRPPGRGMFRPDRRPKSSEPMALWLVLTVGPMGALAGFESPTAASGKGDNGLASIPLSPWSPASNGLPGPSVACSPRRRRADGALAGFGTQADARMYFATVSRSTFNSRAIRRFRHPSRVKLRSLESPPS